MSSIVRFYTADGFIMAADGRSSARDSDVAEVQADHEIKVFHARAAQLELLWSLTGHVGTGNTYNLITEAQKIISELSSHNFRDYREYLDFVTRKLQRYIGESKRDGIIERFPEIQAGEEGLIVSLLTIGYDRNRPFWMDAHVYHRNQKRLTVRMSELPVSPGLADSHGSPIVRKLIESGDARFAEFRKRIMLSDFRTATMEDAIAFSDAVISSQCTETARQMDSFCEGVGGHIHIASLTHGGFSWIRPPL